MNKLDWENSFQHLFHDSWHLKIKPIIESPEVYEIYQKLKLDSSKGMKVVPLSYDVFKCFQVDLNNLRVCMFGQDVYASFNNGKPAANGRAFCCENYGKVSPSLEKLYKGIVADVGNEKTIYDDKNLSLAYLERQGVMLCNASLTTIRDKPGKHEDLWKPFWKQVFEQIFSLQNGLIFIGMGKSAEKLISEYSTPFIHYTFFTEHPVKASYENRDMIHNNVFSKTNKLLEENNGKEFSIYWLPSMEDLPF